MIKKQLILIYRTHRVFSIALFLLFKHFKIFMTYLYFNNVFVYLERDFWSKTLRHRNSEM